MALLSTDLLVERIGRLNLASRGDLVREFRASPATINRCLDRAVLEGRLVRIGQGRSTRYAARAALPGVGATHETCRRAATEVAIYRVTETGRVQSAGRLIGLAGGRTFCDLAAGGYRPLGNDGNRCFESLPFFLFDLRPQGFLGRRIAQALPGYPEDPARWGPGWVIEYLLHDGVDLPGNLLLGERAVEAFSQWSPSKLSPTGFGQAALDVLAGVATGSSAGGEQPKFLAEVEGRQVLVKFSPPGTDPASMRWRDLLVAEHLALVTLTGNGISAVESRIIKGEDRLFLETVRMDRCGPRGRLPVVSLEALDAEYAGHGSGWSRVLSTLHKRLIVDAAALEAGRLLDTFGALIENTDRHLGNLILRPAKNGRFALAPAYDILPMRFAPVRSEPPPSPIYAPPVQCVDDALWRQAVEMAEEFWRRVATDPRISPEFQVIACNRADEVGRLSAEIKCELPAPK